MSTPAQNQTPVSAEDVKAFVAALKAVPEGQTISREGIYTLTALVITSPNIKSNEERKELIEQIRRMSGVDRWTFRNAIWLLGIAALLAVSSLLVFQLYSTGKDFSAGIIAIGSSAIGGLAGLLNPHSK